MHASKLKCSGPWGGGGGVKTLWGIPLFKRNHFWRLTRHHFRFIPVFSFSRNLWNFRIIVPVEILFCNLTTDPQHWSLLSFVGTVRNYVNYAAHSEIFWRQRCHDVKKALNSIVNEQISLGLAINAGAKWHIMQPDNRSISHTQQPEKRRVQRSWCCCKYLLNVSRQGSAILFPLRSVRVTFLD